MSFQTDWVLRPLRQAGPLKFGMSFEDVVAVLGQPDQPPARLWRSETKRAGWREGIVAVHFNPQVVFVELSRGTTLAPQLLGLDVFGMPASELVSALESNGHSFDPTGTDGGHSYTFLGLQVGLWRQVVPAGDDDREGRHFDTVGVGAPGYYS